VVIVASSGGMAIVWMVVISTKRIALIKLGMPMTIFGIIILAILNLIIGYIPGVIIMLIYLVINCILFCWIRNLIEFAAIIMAASVSALKVNVVPL
jgi:hypothetical protein